MADAYMATSILWHCGCGKDHRLIILGDSSGAADLASAALADQHKQGIRPLSVQCFTLNRDELDGYLHEEYNTCPNIAPNLLAHYREDYPMDPR